MPGTTHGVSLKTFTSKSTRADAVKSSARKKPSGEVSDAAPGKVFEGSSHTIRAKLFQNGRSQAVRLPKEFRFEGKEVQVSRHGDGVLLHPIDTRSREQRWANFLAMLAEYRDLPPFPECEDQGVTEPEDIFPEGW